MLTVKQIENAEIPQPGKRNRLTDGLGLYLQVESTGRKYWRQKYHFGGKEKLLSHGVFPEVGLLAARTKRDEARALLKQGIDPGAAKQAAKRAIHAKTNDPTFRGLAEDWFSSLKGKAPGTMKKNRWLLDHYLLPALGGLAIDEVTPKVLKGMLQPIVDAGKPETAHRAKMKLGEIFRLGVEQERAKTNPTATLHRQFSAPEPKHHPARTVPTEIGAMLRTMDAHRGDAVVAAALKLTPLVLLRPGELRNGRWAEVAMNEDPPVWRIPGHRMKGEHSKAYRRQDHIVPLSRQAVAILKELQRLTGQGELMFPGRTKGRPISENTVNAALRGLAINDQTAHGFRTTASTCLSESGHFRWEWSERQLDHDDANDVRDAYNRAQYLPQRVRMLQWYADYLDWLREGMPEGRKPVPKKRKPVPQKHA